jgi:hypothetical protein
MSGIKISQAILAINPTAQVGIKGDDLNTCEIKWFNGTAEISKADIQAKLDETAYIDKRKEEYPSIEELVVALYDTEDKLVIETKRAEVKAKYPKT